MNRSRTAKQQRTENRGNGPGFLGMEELALLVPAQLTWSKPHEMVNCAKSSAGHTITGVRKASGNIVYNAWSGEPHKSHHLNQGFDEQGLALCKDSCERHYRNSISNNQGQMEFQR